jgi:integrase/recombinase XerD
MKQLTFFETCLRGRKYRPSTVQGHVQNLRLFMSWAQAYQLPEPEFAGYNDLLSYVQYEQQKGLSVSTINLRLGSISKYYECVKREGLIAVNPAKTLRIKGGATKVVEQPLAYRELENLYHQYKALQKQSLHQRKTDLAHQRNIIITGLLVWQGLHSGELQQLEIAHIRLSEGLIYIPSTARSNSRELALHTQQVLSLHHYLHGGIREQLQPKEEELFPGSMHNTVNALVQELQGINPAVRNAQHIRSSVILHWLQQHHKRQVQYMAGHKYIDSTERYEVQELVKLTEQVSRHHPFG